MVLCIMAAISQIEAALNIEGDILYVIGQVVFRPVPHLFPRHSHTKHMYLAPTIVLPCCTQDTKGTWRVICVGVKGQAFANRQSLPKVPPLACSTLACICSRILLYSAAPCSLHFSNGGASVRRSCQSCLVSLAASLSTLMGLLAGMPPVMVPWPWLLRALLWEVTRQRYQASFCALFRKYCPTACRWPVCMNKDRTYSLLLAAG
jgi:hypothetical protein